MSIFGRAKMGVVQVPKDVPAPTMNLSGYQFQMNPLGVWVLLAAPNGAPVPALPALPAPAAPATPGAGAPQVQELQRMLQEERMRSQALENQVGGLQKALVGQSGGANGAVQIADLNAKVKEQELEIARIRSKLDEQQFRNRVLLAMVTISEGDYIQLCDELQKDPRECNVAFNYVRRSAKESTIPLTAQFAPHA